MEWVLFRKKWVLELGESFEGFRGVGYYGIGMKRDYIGMRKKGCFRL
jgi:hypothetical protein